MSCVHIIHTYNMHTAAHLHAYRHAGYFKLGPSVFQHTIFIPQMGFDCPCGAFELSTRAVIPSGKRFEKKTKKSIEIHPPSQMVSWLFHPYIFEGFEDIPKWPFECCNRGILGPGNFKFRLASTRLKPGRYGGRHFPGCLVFFW